VVLLGRVIVLLGCGAYVAAVAYAGWLGLNSEKEPSLGDYLPTILTGLGGALATVFGAAFGLSDPKKDPNQPSLLVTQARLAANFRFPATMTIIAWAYFVALGVGTAILALDPDKSHAAEPIRDVWKTLVGVVVGVIYVQSGKKSAAPKRGRQGPTSR
jgi:membrane associated rhomboid family serine protease